MSDFAVIFIPAAIANASLNTRGSSLGLLNVNFSFPPSSLTSSRISVINLGGPGCVKVTGLPADACK